MAVNKIVAVVDDDPIFQVIAKKMMAICAPDFQVIAFDGAKAMLDFLKSNETQVNKIPSVMLLDINMPLMDGWMFLEEYQRINESVKNSIKIYLASSSIDLKDINRARQERYVVDYIIKPLTEEVARKITTF